MTFEEHIHEIAEARNEFNRAVSEALHGGFNVSTRLSGNGASIYECELSRRTLNCSEEPLSPSKR